MDICKYVKIQLIEHPNRSKCKYVNGVVIKKGVAHKRMERKISNPRMIILANSLGYMRDDDDFIDIDLELRQEETYLQIILRKIEKFKPNLIIVEKDISEKARDELYSMGITCVKNVKKSVIDRIERLTRTPALPNINLLSEGFHPGKCEKFYVESLRGISLQKNAKAGYEHETDIIFLDGCDNFLGCTLLLSAPKMDELKIVKHALKKILRLSRQLYLEHIYYERLGLVRIPKQPSQHSIPDPFLHEKHMERDFLIFKEVSFSKRGVKNRWEDDANHQQDPKDSEQQQ
jgi:chaperonin GroEL (HSP60 family)